MSRPKFLGILGGRRTGVAALLAVLGRVGATYPFLGFITAGMDFRCVVFGRVGLIIAGFETN